MEIKVQEEPTNNPGGFAAGMAAGALAAYLLDARLGRRRRRFLIDQLVKAERKTQRALGAAGRDTKHRAKRTSAWVGGLSRQRVDDTVLEARVRSALGRASSHPGAITVAAHGGVVTLTGPILRDETQPLLARVQRVRGVRAVDNQLAPRDRSADVPALQGGRRRAKSLALVQENWSPFLRLIAVIAGVGLLIAGISRRRLGGGLLGGAGLALFARGLTNLPLRRLTGIGAGRRGVELHKTINIKAPRDRVFSFWMDYENFPRFMASVEDVRDLGRGQSRWTVKGPLGTSLSYDAELTRYRLNEELGWRSVPGSVLQHAGFVTFRDNRNGSTQVNVIMAYNAGGGAVAHVLADILGADPKTRMDQDLVRMKSMLEAAKLPTQAAQETLALS